MGGVATGSTMPLRDDERFGPTGSRWQSSEGDTRDYSKYLSALSQRREPSAIRALQPLLDEPGMVREVAPNGLTEAFFKSRHRANAHYCWLQISLGGGMPNPKTFPFVGATFTVADGTQLVLDETDLNAALQYSSTTGVSVRHAPSQYWCYHLHTRAQDPCFTSSCIIPLRCHCHWHQYATAAHLARVGVCAGTRGATGGAPSQGTLATSENKALRQHWVTRGADQSVRNANQSD